MNANMLYIDQPVGVGFSYGNDAAVDSTPTAAPDVWTLLQVFYARFPQYKRREFGIFTEVSPSPCPYPRVMGS